MPAAANHLFFGDNLEIMRERVAAGSVDLVYLDPPFNSNRNYNVIFNRHGEAKDGNAGQIQAFSDAWRWTHVTGEQYMAAVGGGLPSRAADALGAMRALLGENDAMAYLVNMAPRLAEMYRVLKPAGSLYLHCDPTMSHYLKVLLDAIFGPVNFRNEIIWKRTSSHNDPSQYGRIHDAILFYAKSAKYTWNTVYVPYDQKYLDDFYRFTDPDGRRFRLSDLTGPGISLGASGATWRGISPGRAGRCWSVPKYLRDKLGIPMNAAPVDALDALDKAGRIAWPKKDGGMPAFKRYLDEMPGVPLQSIWTDVASLGTAAHERLGYPTQKPVALLERIIKASSNPGDVVLDPFCGCGTTIDAAHRLGRRWTGIDVTYLAIDLIDKRLKHRYPGITDYEIHGIPKDTGGARALFDHSPFDFERWAVSQVGAQPNEKQVGDKGADGIGRFLLDGKGSIGKMLVSVKGGKTVGPTAVRDLSGTVHAQKAQMGVLVTMEPPTRGVTDAADHGGSYTWPPNGQMFPRIQVITVAELLAGKSARTPPLLLPYVAAVKAPIPAAQHMLVPEGT